MAAIPPVRISPPCTTSSDSEESNTDADSAMLASCSLQEIRQEDLAAILPDQQDCDAFGGFECEGRNNKAVPESGDVSGSDMELPSQVVSAAIQRATESSSETESQPSEAQPTVYSSALLQQFVQQTQLLNTSLTSTGCAENMDKAVPVVKSVLETQPSSSSSSNDVKRKRGRPRKEEKKPGDVVANSKPPVPVLNGSYCHEPNVSPDSGIQDSPDHLSSPEPSPKRDESKKTTSVKKNDKKIKKPDAVVLSPKVQTKPEKCKVNKVTLPCHNLDRVLYANTDRVLYPPRRKVGRPSKLCVRRPGRPPKYKTVASNAKDTKENSIKLETKNKNIKAKVETKSLPVKVKLDKLKKIKTDSDHEIVQLTTNTNGLSLGKANVTVKKVKQSGALLSEICERVSKRLEQNKPTLGEKNVCPVLKTKTSKCTNHVKNKKSLKYITIKQMKVMHTKHKHVKHKKHKIKILKALVTPAPDPKINSEIEKLIADFIKYCNIGVSRSQKENIPEIFRSLKKVTKKRKGSDESRKKKKPNVSNGENRESNSNEQRLPLKKRHYHVSTNENKTNDENNTSVESVTPVETPKPETKTITRNGVINKNVVVPKTVEKGKVTVAVKDLKTPPAVTDTKVVNINNNTYAKTPARTVDAHINEAIEACINRYAPDQKPPVLTNKTENKITNITATTPKKRHRLQETIKMENQDKRKLDVDPPNDSVEPKTLNNNLETVVTELKNKKLNTVQEIAKKIEKKPETIAQMITRKKNRLEDLASSLVSKMSTDKKRKPELSKLNEMVNRATVIKTPTVPRKIKPSESDKLPEFIIEGKPTGIFLPTVDLELHIPASTIPTQPKQEKEAETSPPPIDDPEKLKKVLPKEAKIEITKLEEVELKEDLKTDAEKKRIRRRKVINRTGFPTKKKKKKLMSATSKSEVDETSNKVYDRVPRLGEEASTFVQRTEKCTLSVVSLEKLQEKPENSTKWEEMSECESLPLDERIYGSDTEQSKDFKSEKSSLTSFKLDQMSLRSRDVSPATSVETRSSDRTRNKIATKSDVEVDRKCKRKRLPSTEKPEAEKRPRRITDASNGNSLLPKRRLRDVSPSSGSDVLNSEKRVRSEDATSVSGDESKRSRKIPRWRKKYLVAGLFSDYYKEDNEAARLRRNEAINSKTRLIYKKEEHPYGLLPPPYHCGRWLRCRKVPFQLPHDLWWQHTHSILPGRDLVPSWNYRKIRTNVYCARSTSGACEPQPCNCSTSSGCGDDCINRLVLAECPATHRCQNQKIQRHEWAPGLEKFMTDDKGWGVRTKMPIKCGEFILEYVGEVVSDQEFKQRMATRYAHDTHHYCLHLDGGLVIDGHRMGGDGRFVNHSCQPNCEMQKWSVNGQFRMALFALRDIQPHEELTYDYNFSLFNPAEGQVCKCGSDNCRGVIGGKSQRVKQSLVPTPADNGDLSKGGRVGRPRKNQARRAASNSKEIPPVQPPVVPVVVTPQIRPISHQQKCFVLEHHCFLLRNLYKARKRVKEKPMPPEKQNPSEESSVFLSQLNALRQPRNIRTRRLAQAEENPELNKAAHLATILRDLITIISSAKDEKNELLCTALMTLPSKRKVPEYYQRINDPIDLSTIELNIDSGFYRSVETFDADMNRLFSNTIKYFGRSSEMGTAATRLRKIYGQAKQDNMGRLEGVLGEKPTMKFSNKSAKAEEEDIIRCICGLYRDEGLMIQCERCFVWQHCECVKADTSAPSYHCEKCVPRDVDLEIPLDEYTEQGHRYYVSLLRGDLQLRQGDTVYVLRDIPIPGTNKKHTYKTIGEAKYCDMDIFRIEQLWKDSKTGQRYAFGHHYLRPHETYHEPTRKFFPNEVMRVPLYEVVPVELIMSVCWVLDINTYCKGRPIGASEEHVYICEYRVDKSARLFSKVSKSKYPICTKSYAFEKFEQRLKISRTYTPHELDPSLVKPRGRRPQDNEAGSAKDTQHQTPVHIPVIRSRAEQKTRLNNILLQLLSRMPTKQPLDVSYLLEGGRRRKKQQS